MTYNKKITSGNPNWLEFWTFQGIWSHKIEKGSGIVKLDMASENIPRMEELESGQQEMQEKISRATKMMTNLTKKKGITDDLGLQREPTSWKGGIDPSILPNSDDSCEQGRLKKDPFGRSKHVDMQ